MSWYLKVLKNYVGFQGRASRKEYWMFQLFNFIVFAILFILADGANSDFLTTLMWLYYVGVLLPSLAVSVRRMHDIGKSGWMLLCGLIPFVGGILLLVWSLLESQPNDNKYGPNPHSGLSINPSSEFAATTETIFCSQCGTKTPLGKFCTKCGHELKM